MVYKSLKLFFFSYILFCYPCFSQGSDESERIVREFNSYLKATRLDELIKATDYSFKTEITQSGSIGLVKRQGVNVLTLEPVSDFDDPLKLSAGWRQVIHITEGKIDIYSNLFFKLAAYTLSPLEKVAIVFKTSEPKLFSFLIFFDRGIKVNSSIVNVRDPLQISLSADDLYNSSKGGSISPVKSSPAISANIISGLKLYFQKHRPVKFVKVEVDDQVSGIISFNIKNVKGHVLPGNYNEIIHVNVFVRPTKNLPGMVDVSFFFTVHYAGGILEAPPSIKSYQDAISDYGANLAEYGSALTSQLDRIVHEKK